MLGFHNNDRCAFDLWSPVDDRRRVEPMSPNQFNANHNRQHERPNDYPHTSSMENRSFSSYVKHAQEVEDVISMICDYGVCSIMTDDDFSNEDLRYIEEEVFRRTGITVNITD